jgi:hypothetical protein
MSATGRGPRLGGNHDDYETPAWAVHRLLEAMPALPLGPWLEPCAGWGAIIRAVRSLGRIVPAVPWRTCEVQAKFQQELHSLTGAEPIIKSFLATTAADFDRLPVHVITNPPFALAEEIIRHARALFPQATVTMLLRLNFLASKKRQAWLSTDTPDVYVLPDRPSFHNRKTDATEYGWMVWPPERRTKGTVQVLAATPKAERLR